MSKFSIILTLITVMVALLALSAFAEEEKSAPTVAEQIKGLEGMCAENADARSERQAKKPLHARLGGDEKIAEMFRDIVKRHRVNETIKIHMKDVNDELLVRRLVEFVSAGTGGGGTYTGRSMPDAHRYMKLTDADFLAAGGDVIASMTEMGYGQEEIDEFVCILVSLKDQVVFK